MKPFLVHPTSHASRLVLPIQFMKFGVDDQEIVVPIRRREKDTTFKGSREPKAPEWPPIPGTELP